MSLDGDLVEFAEVGGTIEDAVMLMLRGTARKLTDEPERVSTRDVAELLRSVAALKKAGPDDGAGGMAEIMEFFGEGKDEGAP